MNKRNRLTISIIAAIVLLACACPATGLPTLNGQPTPFTIDVPTTQADIPTQVSEVPTLPPLPPSNELFSDNFEAPSNEMETFSDESGSAETSGGVYVLRSTGDVWNSRSRIRGAGCSRNDPTLSALPGSAMRQLFTRNGCDSRA